MSFFYKHILALFKRWNPYILSLQIIILLQSNCLYAGSMEGVLDLEADNFEHIEFKRIKQSRYSFRDQQLHVDIEGSASFLMKSFDSVRKVRQVSFKWRTEDNRRAT